jgi:selenocysteine-specific elongation factor
MLDQLAATGFAGPSTKALLAELGKPPDGETLLAHLIREGEIVRVPPDILYNATQLGKMRSLMQEFFSKNESMNVGSLKEILGVSRKQAVPLLEWSDQNRWTERRGDIRVEGQKLRVSAP